MKHFSWGLGALALSVVIASLSLLTSHGPDRATAAAVDTKKGLAAFSDVARVLRHPRCLNCHTVTDYPRVGDDRRRHRMNVLRGSDDHGVPGQRCVACHQDRNQPASSVPGAPHWGLAPLSMGWEGLDDRALAESLLDRMKNGDRSQKDLLHHMEKDPLVLWAWKPGAARALPPVSHPDFVDALKRWFDNGAPLPTAGVTSY